MKVIATHEDGAYPVRWVFGNGVHRVTYGAQSKVFEDDLNACHEFGECVRHSMECEGAFNDDPDELVEFVAGIIEMSKVKEGDSYAESFNRGVREVAHNFATNLHAKVEGFNEAAFRARLLRK